VEKNCNRQGNTVRTWSLLWKLRAAELQPSERAIPSGRGLNMETRGAHYGKPVAQKTVWMLSATVRTLSREICFKLVLGLLSLYTEASRHVFFTKFGIELFIA